MTCREFINKVEGLTLDELSSADAEVVAHQGGCTSCGALWREKHALAGAMRVLRSSTSTMEAPSAVEQNVLRAFRQGAATTTMQQHTGFRLSEFFGWRTYAVAAAAALAIALGLGLWFAQRADKSPQQAAATTQPAAQPSASQAGNTSPLPVQVSASKTKKLNSEIDTVSPRPSVTTASLAQSEQAQGYTPLMLCDPISCSDEAQVVRMELPATAADGSASTQMADVIVGDDGLVRAIRIVQQQ